MDPPPQFNKFRVRKFDPIFLFIYFQLIKPEEMVSPDMDEQSMMTYLSQYPAAKLKPGAPLRPKANPGK